MKIIKSHIPLTALVLSFVFSNAALASESMSNENIDNSADKTTSNAVLTDKVSSNTATAVTQASTEDNSQPQVKVINEAQSYQQQREEHRRQVQQAQQESYKRFLERRKQYSAEFDNNIPADIQERRNAFIKQMEERRAFNVKMMEQHRKQADERREAMQIKMHQTTTAPEQEKKV